jgi:hypothetical protein
MLGIVGSYLDITSGDNGTSSIRGRKRNFGYVGAAALRQAFKWIQLIDSVMNARGHLFGRQPAIAEPPYRAEDKLFASHRLDRQKIQNPSQLAAEVRSTSSNGSCSGVRSPARSSIRMVAILVSDPLAPRRAVRVPKGFL